MCGWVCKAAVIVKDNFVTGHVLNWEAIASIATLAAVGVALWPIFKEDRRRKAVASNLRARLLTQFTILRPIIIKRINLQPSLGAMTSEPLSGMELEPLRAIEEMLPQAIVLRPREHDLVVLSFTNLSLWRHMEEIESRSAERISELVDSTIRELQTGSWLQGKIPQLPWKRTT